jgi:histidine triad (HIT) family protein
MACVFCQIVEGKIPAKLAASDDRLLAFHDLKLEAPTYLLVILRRHVESLNALGPGDDDLVGAMVRKARDLARELGFGERGFRLVFNCGDDAGYSVYHIHLHLLSGRKLDWPPG